MAFIYSAARTFRVPSNLAKLRERNLPFLHGGFFRIYPAIIVPPWTQQRAQFCLLVRTPGWTTWRRIRHLPVKMSRNARGDVFLSCRSNSFCNTTPCVRVCSFTVNGSVHIYTPVYTSRFPQCLPICFSAIHWVPFFPDENNENSKTT